MTAENRATAGNSKRAEAPSIVPLPALMELLAETEQIAIRIPDREFHHAIRHFLRAPFGFHLVLDAVPERAEIVQIDVLRRGRVRRAQMRIAHEHDHHAVALQPAPAVFAAHTTE